MLALPALAFAYPEIDPVALQLGPLAIRWYALAYVVGIVLGYLMVRKLNTKHPLFPAKALEDLVTWAVLGIILGGRLGYVLFYKPEYYMEHLLEIPAIWHGGMSFHGGLLGVILSFYLFSRKYQIPYLSVMDRLAIAAPIGLFFGRLANFINGELYGRVTHLPIGMVFPNGGPEPRHPSQLYEAALEGVVLFVVMWVLSRNTKLLHKQGVLSGVFLAGYALCRLLVENVREPDEQIGLIWDALTMGQLLCMPMLLVGAYLIATASTRVKS